MAERVIVASFPGMAWMKRYAEMVNADPELRVVCLHTAAADTRQYRHVLTDERILARWRVIAFDMPYRGKSTITPAPRR